MRAADKGRGRLSRPRGLARAAMFALLLVVVSHNAFAEFFLFRNPVRDIAKIVGRKLAQDEEGLALMVMSYFYVKYGYTKDDAPLKDAAKRMKADEYAHATKQAAKICVNEVAKGFYRMGKAGEKLLKAIIQTAEDAAKSAGDYIEKKSGEYDKKK